MSNLEILLIKQQDCNSVFLDSTWCKYCFTIVLRNNEVGALSMPWTCLNSREILEYKVTHSLFLFYINESNYMKTNIKSKAMLN